jgi:uncharacterized membrane protein YedE/YeeE
MTSPGSRSGDRVLLAVVIGALFAVGLGLSGMTDPANVLGFLDVTGGAWDPTLAFVMAGAILVHAPLVRIAKGRARPWRADRFDWPTKLSIEPRLVVGAALFGVGWGLAGYCPGPVLVGIGQMLPRVAVFVGALVVGAMIGRAISGAQKK